MSNRKELKKMRWLLVLTGTPVTILQWVGIVLGFTKGWWWLLAIWAMVAIPWGIWASTHYFRRVAYICPQCHRVFKPALKQVFWASHTPSTRKLTCPECGHRGYCVEVYDGGREAKADA